MSPVTEEPWLSDEVLSSPACRYVILIIPGRSSEMIFSVWDAVTHVRSRLVPAGSSILTVNSADSAAGMNSLPILGIRRAVPASIITARRITVPLLSTTFSSNLGYHPECTGAVITFCFLFSGKSFETSIGIISIATRREERSANATVRAWSLNISPEAP